MIIPKGASVVHSTLPYIAEYSDFLTKKQCKAIMKVRKQTEFRQGHLRIDGRRQVNLEQRNAFTHVINQQDDIALTRWIPYVADWLGLPNVQWIENALLIHYPPGGEFKLHTDVVSNVLDNGQHTHRVATLIVYVNDDYQDGHTEFPMHKISIKPETGKALLFSYNYADSRINHSTVHIGQKVSENKYIMVFFIRDQEYPDSLRAVSYY
jgi:hypothetical protein